MKVIQIIENTTVKDTLKKEHGLSTYVEACGHKILFDMGQSDAFAENASALGLALEEVDFAVLSHGHYDHGGGLGAFLKINQKAKVYMSKHAFEPRYSDRPDGSMKYIGLDQSLKGHPRIVPIDDVLEPADGLVLFSNRSEAYMKPPMNIYLYKEAIEGLVKDDFNHEINLSVKTEDGAVLIAGCAHQGILNIVDTHHKRFGAWPQTVIGGFHLSSGSRKEVTGPEYLEQFAVDLKATPCHYYTCHCTGVETYELLKETMGDRLDYFGGGMTIEL